MEWRCPDLCLGGRARRHLVLLVFFAIESMHDTHIQHVSVGRDRSVEVPSFDAIVRPQAA